MIRLIFIPIVFLWLLFAFTSAFAQVDCEAVQHNSKITADEIARVYKQERETGISDAEVYRLGELTLYLIYLKEVFITNCEIPA